jgi:hypothetical protein
MKTWMVLLLLAARCLSAAQTQSFDIVSFEPLAGWNAVRDRDHVTFTLIDNAARAYVMLAVYNSAPAAGDAERDFAAEWQELVAKSFVAGAAPPTVAGHTRGGLRYREGSAQVKQGNGQTAFVKLLAFSAGRRRFSVMLVATSQAAMEKQQAATQSFVDSLALAGQDAASTSAVAPNVPANAAAHGHTNEAGAAPRPGNGLSGVWMGFKQLYGEAPSPRWYTFYDDGQIFEDIPRAGFTGFSREASQADSHQHAYWGTYNFSSGAGIITKPGVRYPEKMLDEGAGKLKIDSGHFYRCHPVDGLRLQGAWTSLANPNDPDLDRWPMGQRPVFRFNSDGKFTDEGVFATFLKSGDPRQDAAGSGAYEIRDFTLVLRFADGRVKQLAITGMLSADPAAQNDTLFIARSEFHKRSR